MTFPGKSRRIRVEPVRAPSTTPAPKREPAKKPEPKRKPVKEPVPA